MRNIISLSCIFHLLSCVALAAYEVVVFGDVHYDSRDVRDMSIKRPAYQEREMNRNIALWAKSIPAMFSAAEKKAGRDTSFVVQLGDIVQGDCGSGALHEKALRAVLKEFQSHFQGMRILAVPGNHDIRGAGAGEAYDRVMRPYLGTTLGESLPASGGSVQYAVMQGGDLYVCLDCNHPDLSFLQASLAAHPNRRHLFLLTHFPVLPLSQGRPLWTLFDKKPELREPLVRLLAENHAIVLCAHVHITTLVRWQRDNGSITQVSLSSLCRPEQGVPGVSERNKEKAFAKFMDSADSPQKQADLKILAGYLSGYKEFKDIRPSSCFAVLKPGDAGVTLELYTPQAAEPVHTFTLK